MNALCQPNNRGRCVQCRAKLPADLRRTCRAFLRAMEPPCIHLGEQTRVELIRCATCNGNVRIKFPVHACAVFGECLPTYTGEHQLAKCHGCERREPAGERLPSAAH
jgi:hypothetical protein